MKKISIIIPVYNAMTSGGGYINRCVDSVLNQKNFSMNDVEVLLINDGSTDTSLETLREIERKNPRIIRLIDQENMGVAKTRNKAVGLATGEYTTFLDQDDWIDEDFFMQLYAVACQTKADVVASGYRRPDKNGKVIRTFHLSKYPYSRYTLSAAWAKLHRTAFLIENAIEFFDNSFGEDLPFSVHENVTAVGYEVTSYCGYNWYFNEGSVSNTDQKKLTLDGVRSLEKLLKHLFTIKPVVDDRNFYYYILRTTVFYILFSGRGMSREDFLEMSRRLFLILSKENDIFLRENLQKFLIAPKGERLNVVFIVTIFILMEKTHLSPVFASIWCRG